MAGLIRHFHRKTGAPPPRGGRAIRSNFCSAKIPLLSLAREKAFGFRLPKTAKAVLILRCAQNPGHP
jgi:hypothetical protein